jgi:glycosyltransferase involved in cell wall biosynthesis
LLHGDLPGFLRAADVYVSASSSDGTSSSLLEAMASGLYPVVSDITANRPWVEHGKNGLLFAVGDAASLAEALRLCAAQRASWTDILRGIVSSSNARATRPSTTRGWWR